MMRIFSSMKGLRLPYTLATLFLLGIVATIPVETHASTRPLPPVYKLNQDGSVVLELCYNWSCATRHPVLFHAQDMSRVLTIMAQCGGASIHQRLQRLRMGVWLMEELAEKAVPILANDTAMNIDDRESPGRTDCVDNSTNTTTYLQILSDLGQLPGWNIAPPEVRDIFDIQSVHWTAVVTDGHDGRTWSVDSWFRPNGHLPFVMPLKSWKRAMKGWEPPLDVYNPYPEFSSDLCLNSEDDAPSELLQADSRQLETSTSGALTENLTIRSR